MVMIDLKPLTTTDESIDVIENGNLSTIIATSKTQVITSAEMPGINVICNFVTLSIGDIV